MQLVQTEGFGQGLLGEGLFGEHRGDAVGAFLALRWIQQYELLNLAQLFHQLFHGDSVPGGLRLFMEMLQQRDAQHAIKSMDANLAIGPVIHRPPSQPVAILEAAKDSLDFLLARIAHGDLLGSPVRPIGEQHRATQTMIDEPLPSRGVKFKLQPPPRIGSDSELIPPRTGRRASVGSYCESGSLSSGLAVYSVPWKSAAELGVPC